MLANGVLGMAEDDGVIPMYFINLMPVIKKDDNGVEYCPMVALRIVNDCTMINQLAAYAGTYVDRISECVNWAALASTHGLNAKTDVSQCYFCMHVDPSMYPMMCIQIPDIGVAYFKRLPQGWSFSMQHAVTTLQYVLWKFGNSCQRYVDDVFLALPNSNSEKEFVELWENFMKTLKKYNLRIKGSKTFLLNIEFNFLGYRISEGAIEANPHSVNRIMELSWKNMKTVKSVMALLGMVRFLAKFMKRSTHVLHGLTQAVRNKKPAELIDWTPELIKSFENVMKALGELSKTYPFESDLETVIIVDTSKIATGGLIYQIKEAKPRIVSFFSRSRKDAERKFQFSSCNFEAIGACAILKSHEPWLLDSSKQITLLTDSMSLVKLWRKFKKNLVPSDDIKLNNCLMEMSRYPLLNIMHASNKSAAMLHPDFVSRMGYDEKSKEILICKEAEGVAKCKICELAEIPTEYGEKINQKLGEISAVWAEKPLFDNNLHAKLFQITSEIRVPIAQLKNRNISLSDLLSNKNMIAALQKTDKVYRDIIDCLENGRVNFPRKHARAEAIKLNREPELDNGALTLSKIMDNKKIRVYPIPKMAAFVIIHAVHITMGHRSPTQMCKQVANKFEFENMRKYVDLYIGKCIPCTLLRNEAKYVKQVQKPVKIADNFFKQILCDEIHRQRFGKTVKFMIAIEAISQFLIAIPIVETPKSEDFIAMVLMIKTMLAPHALDQPKLELRCDAASWHKSDAVKKVLQSLAIEVNIHESTTLSRNIIPELDGKIAQFSKQLGHYFKTTNLKADLCAQIAAQKCNTTLNNKGYTPSQLFTGRNPATMKMLDIDAQQYIQLMHKSRQQKRESMDRKNFIKLKNKKKKMIPYENEELNEPLLNAKVKYERMKTGDLVVLNTQDDKNDQNRNLYIIVKINFRGQTVTIKRSGVQTRNNPERIVAFERIARHIKVDVESKISVIHQFQSNSEEWAKIAKINTPEPKYIVTDEDIEDLSDVQQALSKMIPRIILAAQPMDDTMANDADNITQQSQLQAVPSASVDATKLSEDSSWFTQATANVERRKKTEEQLMPGDQARKWKTNDETQFGDYSDYEEVTEEMLSDALMPMKLLNASTQSDYSVISYESEESYANISIRQKADFEVGKNILNSTIGEAIKEEDQVLPEINERPIRNAKKPEWYQAQW